MDRETERQIKGNYIKREIEGRECEEKKAEGE